MSHEQLKQVAQLTDRIQPLLQRAPVYVQAGVLANLMAIHLAGYSFVGEPAKTQQLRNEALDLMVEHVRSLTSVHSKVMGT